MSLVVDSISKRFEAVRVAAGIYSAGVLLYGQRPGLRAMMRAVRVDR